MKKMYLFLCITLGVFVGNRIHAQVVLSEADSKILAAEMEKIEYNFEKVKDSKFGKLLYYSGMSETDAPTIVKSEEAANQLLFEGVTSILVTSEEYRIRYIVMPDTRVVRIYHKLGMSRIYVLTMYLDPAKQVDSKLIECLVYPDGKVSELCTTSEIDPNGKDAFVLDISVVHISEPEAYIEVTNVSTGDQTESPIMGEEEEVNMVINGKKVVPATDPVVVRYQKIINGLVANY